MCGSYTTNLEDLASEVLLAIFKHLYKSDLLNLRLTCWRFNAIINLYWDKLLFQQRVPFLVTNQENEDIRDRSEKILHAFDKHRISTNWKNGAYEENSFQLFKKYVSCLYLEKDLLWLGRGCHIKAYERQGCKINFHKPRIQLNGFKSSHICKFVINNDHILTGNEHGLQLYSIENQKYIFDMNLHDLDISSVDMKSDMIAVGSRNNILYLYRNTYKSNPIFCSKEILDDRIWSVALNPTKLAIGTAANDSLTSIIVYDVNTHTLTLKLDTGQRGAGILNLKWETPSLLWSGGYDSLLRRWDLRVGQFVQSFEDPFLSVVYSFDCDFVNTCITGCESNGRSVLWDTRKNKYIQMYYLKSCQKSSSPIYGLAFDPKHLFAVTERHINILDFSVIQGTSQDYSDVIYFRIVV